MLFVIIKYNHVSKVLDRVNTSFFITTSSIRHKRTEMSISTVSRFNTLLDQHLFPNNTNTLKMIQITHFTKEMKIGYAYGESF